MDSDCVSLQEYLHPIAGLLDPFQFENMRYRFRQWVIFDCNWKVALEAFLEPYHVAGTHPQLTKYGDFYAWSKAQGLHGNDGYDTKTHKQGTAASTTVHRAAKGDDARKTIREMQEEFWETVGASTTETLVNAAKRLVDELPEGTPADQGWMANIVVIELTLLNKYKTMSAIKAIRVAFFQRTYSQGEAISICL
jgi:phenylpropionate dioxygenase-like ring-hydroxylating dioxygenase large terminal subunit